VEHAFQTISAAYNVIRAYGHYYYYYYYFFFTTIIIIIIIKSSEGLAALVPVP